MVPRIQAEYTVVDDGKMLREKLASVYKSKLKLNIFEIREHLWSIKLQECRDVYNYASRIDRNVMDYNLGTGPSTTETDATDTDESTKSLAKMSEQEQIFYLLLGIPTHDKLKVFLELMMDTKATITPSPNEIVSNLIEKEAAIKRVNGLAPEALFFPKQGGGNGGKSSKDGRSPKRVKRDSKGDNDRKEKDLQKCFHCDRQGHTTENCLSKQPTDPAKAADIAAKASSETPSTLMTSIDNYWIVSSLSASSSVWFIDCRCTTPISGH
jgi:hypothetical protein